MIIQNFKDRKEELTLLNKYLNSDKFEFIIIYGRRRIGKTELVLKATEKMKRIYYLALEKNNLDRFYNLCLNHFPELNKYKKDWEVLFDFLKDKVDVIIIDEFQNLIK
ncbi:MAG: AAA family ATPase, partial [Nanoarchaeota archaeon]|nr:AAA family ATPase [Nanoarchaeota archaeon]